MLCVWKTCHAPCTPSGGCDELSGCPSNQACIAVTDRPAGTYACVPGVALGATCDANTSCRSGTICATVSGKPLQCTATCPTPGAGCGQGGLCIPTSRAGCNLCAPP
ncbi:MAG: hypothetical protein IT371_10480 [Deltaproteobacteria bacterium]|nr:hypothetical protein [Deltaproteobacteria bacterium]